MVDEAELREEATKGLDREEQEQDNKALEVWVCVWGWGPACMGVLSWLMMLVSGMGLLGVAGQEGAWGWPLLVS